MTDYVCGFAFTHTHHETNVALIHKRHGPDVVVGRLNGIGGKIERGETIHEAMVREFKEEAGVLIPKWDPFCKMNVPPYGTVFMFSAIISSELAKEVRGREDEEIQWVDVRKMPYYNVVPNLKWLIPMALDQDHISSTSEVIYGS